MPSKTKKILKILSLPGIFVGASLILYFLWEILNLPERDQFIEIVKAWFQSYGLLVVFVSALVEGMLLFGNYYPGGMVIFLGVISAEGDFKKSALVVLIVCLALFFAYMGNYLLGRYGWYKLLVRFGMRDSIERRKEQLRKHQLGAIVGSYWFPNLASLTSTAAGILKTPFLKFLLHSAIGILIWNIFWGTLVAALGEEALGLISLKWAIIIVAVWALVIIFKSALKKKRS